jgi:O-antigen/teichoic acid export membrane protein/aminoglycoside phosphotransferase
MTLLVAISQLNLKSALNRFLPRAGPVSGWFVIRAYLIALAATALVSAVFLVGIGLWTPSLEFLVDRPELIAWFVVATMAWTLFVLQDSVLAGIRQAHWVPVENFVFSASKLLLLLVVVGTLPALGIWVSWTLPAIVLVVPVTLLLFRRLIPTHVRETRGREEPFGSWGIARYAAADYLAYVIWSGTIAVLPLIVLNVLGPDANAYFYVSWLIAYSLYLISSSMGMSMLAEASLEPTEVHTHRRRTVAESARLVVPAALAVAVGAPLILGIMGGSYPEEGVTLLRLLALSAIPFVIVDAHVTAARAQNHMRVVVGTYAALCGLVLALGVPLMSEIGVAGIGVAWLAAQSSVAGAILVRRLERTPWADLRPAVIGLLSRIHESLRELRDRPSSRRAAEAVLNNLRTTRPSTSRWRLRRSLNGLNDVAISEIGPEDHGVAVLKWARRPKADRSLENEERTLRRLWHDARLGNWRGLLPAVLASGTVSRRRYLAESYIDGETADRLLQRGAEPKRVIAAAAASIAPLYEATRSETVVDESLLDELVDQPVAELRSVVVDRSRIRDADHVLERLRDEIREDLTGRTVVTSRVHGDLCPANVLMRPDGGEVTGLVDWERGRSRGLPDLDLLHLEMTTRMQVRGQELGQVVEEMLADGGRRDRTQILLAWLHHVAGNVAKAGRYARSRLWVRRNIDPVLASAVDGVALRPALSLAPVRAVPIQLVSAVGLSAAIALWMVSLGRIDPREMTDLGLLAVLPATFYAALALLTVSFLALLRTAGSRRVRVPLLSAHVLTLIAFLHATPAIVYDTLRYAWAWKHVGIVDYISRHGSVAPDIDFLGVYHNWPGFFSLNSLLTEVGGISGVIEIATWAPVVFSVLSFCALLLVFSALTSDKRVVWLGTWLFFITNWVGQEYFSPQAFAFFLYLVVLGVVLRWLRPFDGQTRDDRRTQRLATALVVLMLIAIAASHALTSLMVTLALAGLVVARVCAVRSLPLISAAIVAIWSLLFAHGAIFNLGTSMLETISLPWSQTESNLADVGELSEGQQLVALVSRGLTAAVIALAIIGALMQFRAGRLDRAVAVLALTPLLLFVGGSYDGEILFRIYLFLAPFLSFLAAQALVSWQERIRSWWWPAIGSAAACIAILGAFLFAYYGKEHQNYFTPEEVTASEYLYSHAPEGALLIDATTNYPRQFRGYERFEYVTIADEPPDAQQRVLADPVGVLGDWMTDDDDNGSFLILTRSQNADVQDLGVLPRGSLRRIIRALMASPQFTIVFQNRDAVILTPARPGGGGTA